MEKSEVTLSVVIPFYNVRQYLSDCVNSVRNSILNFPYELILVDDGSTDGSAELADMYAEKDSQVRVLHINNSGPSIARNCGLNAAQGKYIFFMDSDDLIEPHHLDILCQTAVKTNSDAVFSGFTAVSEDFKQRSPVVRPVLETDGTVSGPAFLSKRMDAGDWHNETWCGLYRRRFLVENSLFFPNEIWLYEDILFTTMVLLSAGRVTPLSEHGYLYRIREKSLAHDGLPDRRDIDACLQVLDAFEALYPTLSPEGKLLLGRVLYQHISMTLYYIGVAAPANRKELFRRLSRKKILNILRRSAVTRKEKLKYLIFRFCIGAYYPLVKKENAGELL